MGKGSRNRKRRANKVKANPNNLPNDNDRIQYYMDHRLNMDDTFRFECKMCGQCCTRRDEAIILSGVDIYYASKELGITINEFMKKYIHAHIGSRSRVPVITLKENSDGKCSLMADNKCSVHNNKPTVCAIYPLGRMQDNDEHIYFIQPMDCPGIFTTKEQTLKEWLDRFDIEKKSEESKLWYKTQVKITKFLIENDITLNLGDDLLRFIELVMYAFDTSLPLMEQLVLHAMQVDFALNLKPEE